MGGDGEDRAEVPEVIVGAMMQTSLGSGVERMGQRVFQGQNVAFTARGVGDETGAGRRGVDRGSSPFALREAQGKVLFLRKGDVSRFRSTPSPCSLPADVLAWARGALL